MRSLINAVRDGSWVNSERTVAYPVIILVLQTLTMTVGVLLGSGLNNALGDQPIGTDFLSFYSVSVLVRDGRAGDAYDLQSLVAVQQEIAGPGSPVYAWLYPPVALFVVAPLSLVDYGIALSLWLVVTGALYVSALYRLVQRPRAILPILAFPAVFLTVGHGQNSFLSAGILAWSLLLLSAGGSSLGGGGVGLLSFKPQLGLLLPVAFVAGRNTRAFLAAALSVVGLVGASVLVFGVDTWSAFLGGSGFSLEVLEEGMVSWEKMISAFAAARLIGIPSTAAWVFQGLVSLGSALVVWRCWSREVSTGLRIAATAIATLLATPFALDYEGTFLGLAIAGLVADGLDRGFLTWERSAWALLWVSPLLWRLVAIGLGLPLGFLSVAVAMLMIVRRARVLDTAPAGRATPFGPREPNSHIEGTDD